MNDSPTQLFDRDLVRRHRLRAASRLQDADFLLRRTADDIAARLDATLRDFPLAVDLSAQGDIVTSELSRMQRIGTVIRCDTAPALLSDDPGPALVCDAECLPLATQSVDLVVSGLQLQWINDLPGTLIQIRRALKPDGLFMAALPGGETLTELRQAFLAADVEISGGSAPRVSPFADIRDLGSLLQRAGFALPVVDLDRIVVRYDTLFALLGDLRAMGATNALVLRDRKPMRRATLLRAAQIYADRFSDGDGRIRATFDIVHMSGWAPHESQQQPLRPGSAKMRLADALGVNEIPTGEKP